MVNISLTFASALNYADIMLAWNIMLAWKYILFMLTSLFRILFMLTFEFGTLTFPNMTNFHVNIFINHAAVRVNKNQFDLA